MDDVQPLDYAAEAAPPTHTRYRVVGLAILLAMITYLDRACISTLAPNIMRDLSLDKKQMGYVFSAFALAYALFEIPTAWWADRVGTRKVLTRIVLWWSAFTVLTAGAFSLISLIALRFLFGAGEAGAWPGVTRTFSRWIPRRERGTIQGIFFAGAHLALACTPLLVIFLLHWLHWRMIFVVFGLIGFVWAAVWYSWFRDDPADHPRVNHAELRIIVAGRRLEAAHPARWEYWKHLLRSRNMIPLCLMYFPNSFAFYFCMTWLPTFLIEKYGAGQVRMGLLAGLPFLLSVAGDLLGGVTTDYLTARFGLRVGRAGLGFVAFLIAGSALAAVPFCQTALPAAILISISVAATMFTLGAAWGTCIDVGGSHSGVLSAAMNTSGQIGAVISPYMVAWFVQERRDWNTPLYIMGGLFLMGAVCWLLIDPRKRVFE